MYALDAADTFHDHRCVSNTTRRCIPTRCPPPPQFTDKGSAHLSVPVRCPVSHSLPSTSHHRPSQTPFADSVLSHEPSTRWTCAHRGPECAFNEQCIRTAPSSNHTIIFPAALYVLAHMRARSRPDYGHPVVCMRSRFC
jgi:hypothetical protein